jgi:alpha-1,2-mannosyltransferase
MISDAVLGRWLPRRSVLLWGDVVRGLLWGVVILVWIVFGQIYLRLWRLTLSDPAHSDFTIFYYTARMVADGLPMYGASPERYGVVWAAGHLGNLNPPHFQLFLQPLAALPYERAYMAWTGANLLALIASLVVIVRTLAIGVTWRRLAIGGALLASAAPFTTVAITSELTFLLLLPFTLAWASAVRGRWATAGAWLGVCAAIKLFFLLFVPWLLLRRRWRALASAAATGVALVLLGLTAYGIETYRLWLEGLGVVGWWWLPLNASWYGLISRLFVGGDSVAPLVHLPAALGLLGPLGFVAIASLSVWAATRLDATRHASHVSILVLLCGAILASPLGWVYYGPLVLGPALGLLASGEWGAVPRRWLLAAGCAAVLLYVPLELAAAGQPSRLATVTLACSYFWGLFVPWAALVRSALRQAAA